MGSLICRKTKETPLLQDGNDEPSRAENVIFGGGGNATSVRQKRPGAHLQEPNLKRRRRHNSHCSDFEFSEEQLISLLQAFEDMALDPPQKIPLMQHRISQNNYPEKPRCLDFTFKHLADSDGFLNVKEMKQFL